MKKDLLLLLILVNLSSIQAQTVGLMDYQQATQDGYVLFSPFPATSTYLIDNCGRLINEWESNYTPAAATILLANGHLLKTASEGVSTNPIFAFGGGGEKIQEIDWDGTLIWEYIYSDSTHRMHHDFVQLANGNLLIPAWELKTKQEAIEAGRDTTLLPDEVLWGEFIIEVNPLTEEIVWEWHMWDHLIQGFDETKNNFGVIAEHPELLDINRTGGSSAMGGKNWLHINSIDYNPMMDQILINSFFISEFFIIDHSTSTTQAASHVGGNSTKGGDLLYRWGNPQNYGHGTAEDRTVFGSHKAHWISAGLADEGKIMYFNNGNGRPDGSYSSIDIIIPPVDDYLTGQYLYTPGVAFAPTLPEWSYLSDPVADFYSSFLSGAQRLPNGNTLICSGAKGRFFEINTQKEIVWEYISPVTGAGIIAQGDTIPVANGRNTNIVFRATRYTSDYAGFANIDLTPGDPIELNFTAPYDCDIFTSTTEPVNNRIKVFPNPANQSITIRFSEKPTADLRLFNAMGQLIENRTAKGRDILHLDTSKYKSGIYFIELDGEILAKFVIKR